VALGNTAPTTLLQPMPVKSQFLFHGAVLSAKRYSLAIFFHYLSLLLYCINYINAFLLINIL